MVRVDAAAVIAEKYDDTSRESIVNALNILKNNQFFEYLVEANNRLIVESYQDESPDELAKKILENRQTNRILLSITGLATYFEGEVQ